MSDFDDFLLNFKNVPRGTLDQLKIYVDHLQLWQKKINLIASGTCPHVWTRHIGDSYQLYQHLYQVHDPIVDVGSGAGFPGMVLAIAGCSNIILVESDQRKNIFLKEIKKNLNLPVQIHEKRFESINFPQKMIIVSRAVCSINQLFQWSYNDSHPYEYWLHKGISVDQEIQEAQKHWGFDYEKIHSVYNGFILKITSLQKV